MALSYFITILKSWLRQSLNQVLPRVNKDDKTKKQRDESFTKMIFLSLKNLFLETFTTINTHPIQLHHNSDKYSKIEKK